MLFNSYVFLFLFLPLSLIGYYLFVHLGKETAAKLVLTAASLIFYAYANPVYLLILLGSILFIGLLLYRLKHGRRAVRLGSASAGSCAAAAFHMDGGED